MKLLTLLKDIFSFNDGWMVYRITVGLGTLFLGISALVGVYYIRELVKLLRKKLG